MSSRKIYPYHPSLRDILRTVDAPLYALRLVRHLEKDLGLNQTEVEILLFLAPFTEAIPYDAIVNKIDYRSEDTIQGLLQKLVRCEYLIKYPIEGSRKLTYELSEKVRGVIRSIDKDDL